VGDANLPAAGVDCYTREEEQRAKSRRYASPYDLTVFSPLSVFRDRVSGTKKGKKMSGDYGTLRLWSNVLNAVGIAGVIFVSIGVILASIGADSLWQLLAILLIGGPIAALFASWPIALGQALDALADVAEYARDQQAIPSQRLSEGERVPSD
jgi:hypothetical protein